MRLTEQFRPRRLADILGQPAARQIAKSLSDMDSAGRVLLLEGPPGVGKTATAIALALELGCDEGMSLHVIPASCLTIEKARTLFEGDADRPSPLHLRPLWGSAWQVVLLEEMDSLPSVTVARYLKVKLDTATPPECGGLPRKVVVVATANSLQGLSAALLQRFRVFHFQGGKFFREAVNGHLEAIWKQIAPEKPVPAGFEDFGWFTDDDGERRWSFREALNTMEARVA